MWNVKEYWKNNPLLVLAIWLVVGMLLGSIGLSIGARTTLPGPTSLQAIHQSAGESLAYRHGLLQSDQVLFVLRAHDQGYKNRESHLIEAREDLHSVLSGVLDKHGERVFSAVQTTGHTWLPSHLFLSTVDKSLLLIGKTKAPKIDSAETLKNLPEVVAAWNARNSEFTVSYLSSGTADTEMFDLINEDLDRSLLITLPITFIVLLISFRTVVAALIPLLIALVSLFASLGFAALISHIFEPISATAAQLVVLLVLAIGVDYSLFFLSRVREEIGKNESRLHAITLARATIGPAILWSGVTVGLSLVGLLVMQDSILHSMAFVSLAAVTITVGGTLFVLPSLLLVVGERIEWGRVRFLTRSGSSSILGRLVRIALSRPLLTIVVLTFLLLFAALPVSTIRLGSSIQPPLLPDQMQSKRAFSTLERSFPLIAGPDLSLILEGNSIGELEEEGALQPFFDELLGLGGITGPLSTELSQSKQVLRYEFRVRGSTNDERNINLVQLIREQLAPKYLSPLGVSTLLGGTMAYAVGECARYSTQSFAVFFVVLALSFLFLLVAFRSLVIPIKAIVLNVLSTAASFGILVFIFQWGGLSVWNHGVVEYFVPALLFSILFGLSMDYHVFLLARITENFTAGNTVKESVLEGIQSTAGTITSAAAIMVTVFSVIATLQLPIMKQLGVGLAIAVLLDATLVRAFLLPASMVLLGRVNWYLPRCLSWLPRIGIK